MRAAARMLALAALVAAPAAAASDDEGRRVLPPPLPFPEGISGAVRTDRAGEGAPGRIDRIRDVFAALQGCWRPPRGGGFSGQEITVRMSFRRSGEVLGEPRITFYKAGGSEEERRAFRDAVRDTLGRCAPLPFTQGFGAAIAGRPFTFRFADSRAL